MAVHDAAPLPDDLRRPAAAQALRDDVWPWEAEETGTGADWAVDRDRSRSMVARALLGAPTRCGARLLASMCRGLEERWMRRPSSQ